MDKCNDELREKLIANTELLQVMSITDRLKFGVRACLKLIAPVLPTWPQALGLDALLQNAPTTFNKLAKLSDEIWYFDGDKSTDVSWYTKRALLTDIYASTELFMLQRTLRRPGHSLIVASKSPLHLVTPHRTYVRYVCNDDCSASRSALIFLFVRLQATTTNVKLAMGTSNSSWQH